MKKNWENATLENIEIAETAGGKDFTGTPDAEWTYDPNTNKWWVSGGENPEDKNS